MDIFAEQDRTEQALAARYPGCEWVSTSPKGYTLRHDGDYVTVDRETLDTLGREPIAAVRRRASVRDAMATDD